MSSDGLSKLEAVRRKALWALSSLYPGDLKASDALTVLDGIEDRERRVTPSADEPLKLNQVRDSVPVRHHSCGIDIVLEQDIPQPWRERFLQASIGSTRIADGLYATNWGKFLTTWEKEMAHLQLHRAARHKPVTG